MRLTSDRLPPVEGITDSELCRIFDEARFGGYIHLWASGTEFIQAGTMGRPGKCCPPHEPLGMAIRTFLRLTGSEAWNVDFTDESTGKQYEADIWLSLPEVKQIFREYLVGGREWRCRYNWLANGL